MQKKLTLLLTVITIFFVIGIRADNQDFYLAEKHYEQGNYKEAKKYYEKYLKKSKNTYLKHIIESKIKNIDGQYNPEIIKQHFKYLNKAVFKQAQKCYLEGNYEMAEKMFGEILKNNNDLDFILRFRALKYLIYCKLEKKRIFKPAMIKDIQKEVDELKKITDERKPVSVDAGKK